MTEFKVGPIKMKPYEVSIDREKGIKIMQGVPTQLDAQGLWNPPETEMILVQNVPHVFKADELVIKDKTHSGIHLSDIRVMIAHGIRSDNRWKFLEGGDVAEIVEAYNRYAGEHSLRPIECLVICNESGSDPMGIRVGEFVPSQNIAYAVGEKVSVNKDGRSRVEGDKAILDIEVEDTMFGLDELIASKEIEPQIKML